MDATGETEERSKVSKPETCFLNRRKGVLLILLIDIPISLPYMW